MQHQRTITIGDRVIGDGQPAYIIAEMSGNHNQSFEEAIRIVDAAKEAGVDAIKLQTYTPDTMTIDSRNEHFLVGKGTIWEGRNLHDLYGEAYTPWDWQPKLKEHAEKLGLHCFSTPFDNTSVDFLEEMNVDAYKIASFELVDLPLIRYVASKGRPMIMSTGMATLGEIEEGVKTAREAGCKELALLKCNSAYPAPPEEMNLRTMPHLGETFGVPAGLSDHTLDHISSLAAVALGACIIEKHMTLSRAVPGPDSAFSLEPQEFAELVKQVRTVEKALGTINYSPTPKEQASKVFRKSIFIVQDVRAGETLTRENVRVIRPGYGMHSRHLDEVIGRTATKDIERGTPLDWELVGPRN